MCGEVRDQCSILGTRLLKERDVRCSGFHRKGTSDLQIRLDQGKAEQMLKMIVKLEDNDDVQNVYANFDIPDEIMEKLSA